MPDLLDLPTPELFKDETYKDELLGIIQTGINDFNPRNFQRQVGPSGVGGCPRKLAWGLAYGAQSNAPGGWASFKGSLMHKWLDEQFKEAGRYMPDGGPRFLSDMKLAPVSPHVDGGTLDLYDQLYQRVVDWKNLSLDTTVPTSTGWTTVAELKVGDELFDANGQVCRVLAKTPIYDDDPCYRVTFDDGSQFVTGGGHLWNVVIDGTTKTLPLVGATMTTNEICKRLNSGRRQRDVRIVNADFLKLEDAELAVHPYLFGAWLGDGESDSGRIGLGKEDADEMFGYLASDGAEIGPVMLRSDGFQRRRIVGLTGALSDLGLIIRERGLKCIPAKYMRASYAQRLALLQGLMDTDGTWNVLRKAAVFTQKDPALAGQVAELIRSLGWKAKVFETKHSGFGVSGIYHDVTFVPFGDNPFRLKRKADLVRPNGSTSSQYRIIHSVELTETVPTQCITVDSPDSTFLIGEGMVPTHNCPGDGTMDKARASNLSRGYFVQAQIYARGLREAGYPVQAVGLMFLAQCGDDLHRKAVARFWKYDENVSEIAFAHVERYQNMIDAGVPIRKILEIAPTLSDFCSSCPVYIGSGDRRAMCPGATPTSRVVDRSTNPFAS